MYLTNIRISTMTIVENLREYVQFSHVANIFILFLLKMITNSIAICVTDSIVKFSSLYILLNVNDH